LFGPLFHNGLFSRDNSGAKKSMIKIKSNSMGL
jgi:hypothetical protein